MLDLRSLIALAEFGSLTEASRAIGRDKGSMSKSISRIASFLDLKLIEKTATKAQISDAGREVAKAARSFFSDLESQATSGGESVTIGGGGTSIHCLLAPVLGGVQKALGNRVIGVRLASSRQCCRMVSTRELEFAIITRHERREDDISGSDVIKTPLGISGYCLLVPEGVDGATSLKNLAKEFEFVGLNIDGEYTSRLRMITNEFVRFSVRCESFSEAISIARANSLVAVVPRLFRGTERPGEKTLLDHPDLEGWTRSIALIYNRKSTEAAQIGANSLHQIATILGGKIELA